MKPIHSIAMAAVATIILLALAGVDPEITLNEGLSLSGMVWWTLLVQAGVQTVINRKTKSHEKNHPTIPVP
jgi:hypothetical protein